MGYFLGFAGGGFIGVGAGDDGLGAAGGIGDPLFGFRIPSEGGFWGGTPSISGLSGASGIGDISVRLTLGSGCLRAIGFSYFCFGGGVTVGFGAGGGIGELRVLSGFCTSRRSVGFVDMVGLYLLGCPGDAGAGAVESGATGVGVGVGATAIGFDAAGGIGTLAVA